MAKVESIPAALENRVNEAVLAHVKDLSAHPDIADILLASVKRLGDVQTFCPDVASYRYYVVSTNGVIFGLAVSCTIAFRLSPKMKSRALITGGVPYPACGDEWVAIVHRHESDWPEVDVKFWALKAYVFVREGA
jgi:hypothetical protein